MVPVALNDKLLVEELGRMMLDRILLKAEAAALREALDKACQKIDALQKQES